MPRRNSSQLVVIYWRDIPSQVNGVTGGEKHKVLLKPRFEKAIDRAAMAAGKTMASDYVQEWRRESRPVEGDVAAAANELAEQFEAQFPLEVLDLYVQNGGLTPTESL